MSRLLRPAVPEDAANVGALMRLSASSLSPGYYDAKQTDLAAQFLTTPDLDLIHDGTLFVVELDGQLVGCGGWSRRKKLFTGSPGQEDLSAEYLDPANDAAKIRAYFIHPGFAKQGVGRQIYEACEDAARSYGFTALELMGTLPGVPFYERLGFQRLEEVNIDLPNGDILPCIRMRKEIGPR